MCSHHHCMEHLIILVPPTHPLLATHLTPRINHLVILKHTATQLFHHILLSVLTSPHLITNHTYRTIYLISCHNNQTHFLPYSMATSLFSLLFITTNITMYHPIRPLLLIHSPTPLNSLAILVTMVLLFLSDLD